MKANKERVCVGIPESLSSLLNEGLAKKEEEVKGRKRDYSASVAEYQHLYYF